MPFLEHTSTLKVGVTAFPMTYVYSEAKAFPKNHAKQGQQNEEGWRQASKVPWEPLLSLLPVHIIC